MELGGPPFERLRTRFFCAFGVTFCCPTTILMANEIPLCAPYSLVVSTQSSEEVSEVRAKPVEPRRCCDTADGQG